MTDPAIDTFDRDTLLEGLRGVGLNGYESSVYLGLVQDRSARVTEISKRTGVPQPKVYQALDSLVEKGFCTLGSDAVNRYRPVPPRVAIEGFVERLEAQRVTARNLADELEDLLALGEGRDLWAPPVEVVKGLRSVKQLLIEHVESARREIVSFCRSPQIPAIEFARSLEEATQRGVALKLLSTPGYYDPHPELEEQVELYRTMRAERRELQRLPTKTLLVDREVALLSITRPTSKSAGEDFLMLVLRHNGLVEHLLNSFEHCWKQASEVHPKGA